MDRRDSFYIDGEWQAPDADSFIAVLNPHSGEVFGSIPSGNAADIDKAVAAAKRAFPLWKETSSSYRSQLLEAVAAGIRERAEELTELVVKDVGMPRKMAKRMQVDMPSAIFSDYAKNAELVPYRETVNNSLILREPFGVVGCITPWNYPLFQIATKIGAAFAAGCTVVLKPSEVAPLAAFVLADIIDSTDMPKGVFNLVTGYGPAAGEPLVTHPDVSAVSFTGSTSTGRRISEIAAAQVKPCSMELGGKSPSIILEDADFSHAVKSTVYSCCLNSGQTCIALTRMLVPESRYREAVEIAVATANRFVVGDPAGEGTHLGPLVSDVQRDRVLGYIQKGISSGAELLAGGVDRPAGLDTGYYVAPTVFGKVPPDSAIAQEEIFGPVLSIITYKDVAEAIEIANGTPYGLGGAVWSKNVDYASEVAKKIDAGQIDINGGDFNLSAPLGGYKQSGHGRELGVFGIEEFLQFKSLQIGSASPA